MGNGEGADSPTEVGAPNQPQHARARRCNLGGAMANAPYCYSQRGHHHTPEAREALCANQTHALQVLRQQPLLERLQCNAVALTMDFSVVYTLGPAIEHTLVIFVVREPVHLAAASHDVMVKLDPRRVGGSIGGAWRAHAAHAGCTPPLTPRPLAHHPHFLRFTRSSASRR